MYMEHVFPNLYGMPKQDVQRFIRDKSGRDRVPPPGFEKMTSEQRVWAGYDKVHSDLSKSQNFRPVAEFFSQSMAQALDEWYPVEEWQSVSLIGFCRNRVAAKGVEALFGTRMFELNPDLIDAFWAFDSNLFVLTLGLSRWVHFRAYRARDRYYGMIRNYLNDASGRTPHDNEAFWSGIIDWFKDNKFDDRVGVGAMAIVMFAALSNTVPIVMWIIIEVIRDPALLQALREEVATAYTTDSTTGENELDIGKVSALPLLHSVLTEVLRLHMNFNLIRNVNQPIVVDGFTIPRGVMLQAPMRTAHYDEAAWGSEGHPAAEFWAERHVTWKEVQDESGNTIKQRAFAMAARPTSFFPFGTSTLPSLLLNTDCYLAGGSHEICPGRHLAKHEILTVVALLIYKFDMEIEGWTHKDGSPSQRAAKNDSRFSGAGAQPPDRDLKMRWRRRQ
jgi:cytochrome P450